MNIDSAKIESLADMLADCIMANKGKKEVKKVRFMEGERNYKVKPCKYSDKKVYCN